MPRGVKKIESQIVFLIGVINLSETDFSVDRLEN